MTRGAILFAFNSAKYDYYAMAEYTARRINHFLNLPVTLVTDVDSTQSSTGYQFDKLITVEPDRNNLRSKHVWINKGRYQAYELSPYDETLLLDVDYMVNSDRLLKFFDLYDDFCCHENTAYYMHPDVIHQEVISTYSFKTLWATAVAFKKTHRARQIFECIEMIQNNYQHYANIHNFISNTYRNDYALTLALRIANGHSQVPQDIVPWNLFHVGIGTEVYKNNNDAFNTEYTMVTDRWKNGKIKKEYLIVKDCDFHIMNKKTFVELMKHG